MVSSTLKTKIAALAAEFVYRDRFEALNRKTQRYEQQLYRAVVSEKLERNLRALPEGCLQYMQFLSVSLPINKDGGTQMVQIDLGEPKPIPNNFRARIREFVSEGKKRKPARYLEISHERARLLAERQAFEQMVLELLRPAKTLAQIRAGFPELEFFLDNMLGLPEETQAAAPTPTELASKVGAWAQRCFPVKDAKPPFYCAHCGKSVLNVVDVDRIEWWRGRP